MRRARVFGASGERWDGLAVKDEASGWGLVSVVSQKGGSPTGLISALMLVQLAILPSD